MLAGNGALKLQVPGGVWGSGAAGPWVASFGPTSSPRWQRILGDDMYTVARVAAGSNGAALVAITVHGAVEFDGVTVGASGKETLVLAQFGP